MNRADTARAKAKLRHDRARAVTEAAHTLSTVLPVQEWVTPAYALEKAASVARVEDGRIVTAHGPVAVHHALRALRRRGHMVTRATEGEDREHLLLPCARAHDD